MDTAGEYTRLKLMFLSVRKVPLILRSPSKRFPNINLLILYSTPPYNPYSLFTMLVGVSVRPMVSRLVTVTLSNISGFQTL